MGELLRALLFDYTLRTVALGAGLLGLVSGALGSYAVLRQQSLLGDAISHAALPGIALAFLLTGSKATPILILGAAVAGSLATLTVMSIRTTTRIKDDSALGIVLSVFFGFGLMLLTWIQRRPDATQAGLDKFLFGQAATLLQREVIIMAVIGLIALGLMITFWKEFKLLSFDPAFGASLGFPIRMLDVLLTTLLVTAIVLGLQTVGVVLMSAMVVAPAAAARQWTNRLSLMIGGAGLFGALAGITGAVLSSTTQHLPTGPTIVLTMSALVAISLCFAPNRGLIWDWFRQQRNRRRLQLATVLGNLQALAAQHTDSDHGHSTAVLRAMSLGQRGVSHSLRELAARGWVRQVQPDVWTLTPAGQREAERLASTRGEI